MQTWSEAFSAYLDANGIEQLQAAMQLKVGPSKVHYWKHGSRPQKELVRRRIERWSKGAVRADLPRQRGGASPAPT